jgi:uncharacterized membrane protein YsdA (DUF1294 family)
MNEKLGIDLVLSYFIIMSILGFLSMAADKRRAVKKAWRFRERSLLAVALLGGGVGSLLGMYLLRHKTKHIKFRITIPIAAVISLFLMYEVIKFIL